MAKIASKGTAIQLSVASVYTTVSQTISIDAPSVDVQTYNATALDSGVGMEKKPTGFVDGGVANGSGFFDPVLAIHQAMTDLLTAPAVALWKIIWSDAALTQWPFSGILKTFQPKADIGDGLKYDFSIELDGMVAYPT
jgi:hypothetical protein